MGLPIGDCNDALEAGNKRISECTKRMRKEIQDAKRELLLKEAENLKKQLAGVEWPVYYGSVKIQIREGIPTLVTAERTIKLD